MSAFKNFDESAPTWNQKSSWFEKTGGESERLLSLLRDLVAPNARFLDIGSGRGKCYRALQSHISPGQYFAVDVSAEMIAGLQQDFPELRHAQLASAEQLPFDADAFDNAAMQHLLHHLPDPAQAIAEAARVLRSGGTLAALTLGGRYEDELFPFTGWSADLLGRTDLMQISTWFQSAGLTVVDAFEDTFQYRFHDPRRVLAFYDLVGLNALAEKKGGPGNKQRLIDRVRASTEDRARGGPYELRGEYITVVGRKD